VNIVDLHEADERRQRIDDQVPPILVFSRIRTRRIGASPQTFACFMKMQSTPFRAPDAGTPAGHRTSVSGRSMRWGSTQSAMHS
jgi:hypothetical protein